MIELTKLNNKAIFVNPHLIETMDSGAETRIYLISGKVIIVKETQEQIISKIIDYRRKLGINGQDI